MHDVINRALADHNVNAVVDLLTQLEGGDIHYAVKRIIATTDEKEDLLENALSWANHDAPAVRHLACALLPEVYEYDRNNVTAALRALAADVEWGVRDAAGRACGTVLTRDFPHMMDHLYDFRTDPSPHVRRAVPVAAMTAGRKKRLDWGEPLLKLIEPLLADRNAVVRKSLGPGAIANGLLCDHPDIAFEYLVKWSTQTDEQVLWNVAMAFSGSGAPPLVKKALIVLRRLSLDDRRYVWRAVASAMWKLGRKRPEIVRPELSRWLEDPRRVEVARAALKYL